MAKKNRIKGRTGYQPPVPRIYQLPAALVESVDRAASTGGAMGTFTTTMFIHLVSEAQGGAPAFTADEAKYVALFTIGAIAGVGLQAALSAARSLDANQSVTSAEDLMFASGLSSDAKEAGYVLATAIRYFAANLDGSKLDRREFIKRFIAESLANQTLADKEVSEIWE